ncbi:MAG TPA: hypothetical protein VK421_11120 [Pyrinomonadaceae bacterium]|nr:hypothetical protein [Pyrinomonadaceae bacterium]
MRPLAAAPPLLLPLCLLAALFAQPARAQQPFYTDDADVTGRGQFFFEAINEFDVLHSSSRPAVRQNTATFTLSYGLFRNAEVSVSAPLITIFNERGTFPRRVNGVGDTSIQIKYNFLKEREGSRLPAMTVAFTVETPTGSVEKGTGSGLFDYSLNGILQKSLTGRTTLRANGGLVFAGNTATGAVGLRTRGNVFTGGASVVRRFSERLALGAEVTGARARNKDLSRGLLQGQVGGNYTLNDRMTLDFGVLAGRYVASPRLGAQVGLSVDLNTRLSEREK